MTRRTCFVAGVIALIAAGLLTLTGCPAGPEAGWSIIGTWTNNTYDGNPQQPGKIVVESDGTFEIYSNSTDSSAADTGTYTIEQQWTEPDYHYFHFKTVQTGSGETWYNLVQLSRNGDLYSANSGSTDYPTGIDPSDPTFATYWRQ